MLLPNDTGQQDASEKKKRPYIRIQSTGDLCQVFQSGTYLTASCFKEGDVISLGPPPLLSLAQSLTGGEGRRTNIPS